ncbi:hypothetical protein QAD02_012057 [Eretmocerus hayati]|uniref:Uncharacterized protein n=1 Tax=Eretmocerus hayati TaxID=131215 RepID=A0ACC2P0B1_9HYME|nr:hypothetical protein QAD02_012057 [Eretmocerus hayati]
MKTITVLFTLIILLLEQFSSLEIRRASTVTKLPENIDQSFKSSLGINGLSQWYIYCDHMSSNRTSRDCDFNLGKTSLEAKDTVWIRHRFQMEARSETSIIVPDYLKVFRFEDEIFLVIWIEYDSKKRRVKHVSGKEMIVGMYVKFVIIDLQKNSTDRGSTTGSTVIMGPSNNILFLRDFKESVRVVLFKKKFEITYPYTSNFDLAQEIFKLNGRRAFGPVGAGDFRYEKHASNTIMYSDKSHELKSQELLLHWPTGLCKEMNCDPLNLVNRESRCGCSTANGNTTSCTLSKIKMFQWDCQQKNIKDGIVLRPFSIFVPPPSEYFMVYTMPGGDLLTLSGQEFRYNSQDQKKSGGVGEKIFNVFHLRKFGINGRERLAMKFAEFHFEMSLVLGHVFDNGGETCVSLLWTNQTYLGGELQCYTNISLNGNLKRMRRALYL